MSHLKSDPKQADYPIGTTLRFHTSYDDGLELVYCNENHPRKGDRWRVIDHTKEHKLDTLVLTCVSNPSKPNFSTTPLVINDYVSKLD